MDEMSWRARLARSNINILDSTDKRWYYEFMYHPYSGQTKWCKTFYDVPLGKLIKPTESPLTWYSEEVTTEQIADGIMEEVKALRRELER